MKKTIPGNPRLAIRRESIRVLSPAQLAEPVGGQSDTKTSGGVGGNNCTLVTIRIATCTKDF